MSDAHSGILGGHYSVEKTFQKIRQKYYWPNITVDVKEFISKCETCQLNKPGTQKPYLYSTPDIPHTPNEKVSIDIMGPFEITNKENPRLPDAIYTSRTIDRQINSVNH